MIYSKTMLACLLLALVASSFAFKMMPSTGRPSMARKAGLYMSDDKVNIVLVGCGVPSRGMGWYHGIQLLEGRCPSATLSHVVEPWFMGAGADSEPGKVFKAFQEETEAKYPTKFHAKLEDVQVSGKSMALIAGRTADNPRLLKEICDMGIGNIYLEKPGAPTVAELEEMAKYAKSKGVGVFMGYNKNVTPYVTQAREAEAANAGATTKFIHNNAYKPEELPECFERNAEGMLKNMAIHECALLVTYYGVTVENIASIDFDADFTSCQTLNGFTDFDKVGFSIDTKDGKSVSVYANRCGGSNSQAIVSVDGKEIFKSITPDAELEKVCEAKQAEHPDWMPYFFLQDEDYVTLKERTSKHIIDGASGSPEGIATIEIAIDALKVAEYLTAEGMKQFAPK